ncbi:MAG: phospho-N-acetylmuramoyl-pentapeptide-transferase [Oscillospiraceae bacterium]|nr:phospho-N-acetylmuramoyl-pentapeptide-transferase [Oscillospiraceae bacterium]
MPFWINLIVALTAFTISAAAGNYLIPLLRRVKAGQPIYELAPERHKSKSGTPTMGGFMFILGTAAAIGVGCAFYGAYLKENFYEPAHNAFMRLTAGFVFALLNSILGFADDYIKVVKKRNLGLRAKQKLVFQFIFAALFLWALYMLGDRGTYIHFPFLGDLELSLLYYPIMMLYMVFLTNAVNLTDGIDGLCGTVTTVAGLSLVMLCASMGLWEYSIFSMALAGSCLGFLMWNLYPAKVFMGDTGSMFLGGAIVAIGFVTRQHLLLALISVVYICEALSVVMQVLYFKATKGKRIFKMSPIHHHFEMSGYSEYKIVITFSTVALVAGIVANIIYNI